MAAPPAAPPDRPSSADRSCSQSSPLFLASRDDGAAAGAAAEISSGGAPPCERLASAWRAARAELLTDVGRVNFDIWLKDAELFDVIKTSRPHRIRLLVPSEYHQQWIAARYLPGIRAAMQRGLGAGSDIDVEVITRPQGGARTMNSGGAPAGPTAAAPAGRAAPSTSKPAEAPDPTAIADGAEAIGEGWCDAFEAFTGRWEVRRPSAQAREKMARLAEDLLRQGRAASTIKPAFAELFKQYLGLQAGGRAFPSPDKVPSPHAGHGLRWCLDRLGTINVELDAHQLRLEQAVDLEEARSRIRAAIDAGRQQ